MYDVVAVIVLIGQSTMILVFELMHDDTLFVKVLSLALNQLVCIRFVCDL